MILLKDTLNSSTESFLQFLTVVIIFVVVLAITYVATRWIAGYERGRSAGSGMEVLDTCRLAQNKYVEIIRIGSRYFAVAICKDTVTLISELSPEDVVTGEKKAPAKGFKEILADLKESRSGGRTDENNEEDL
ncbi:MAG: flagellar biosynthetic protein FliO [Lachnospiraceae bacterium]|nr:flagellar biosynthetic protein FliO [Lachnospiraceae bacterium]